MREIRQRIESLIEENDVVARQVGTAAKTVELDQNKVGRLSRMDAMQGQALAQASQHRCAKLSRELGRALNRIELDDFGHCEECDAMIAFNRLMLDPTVHYCIGCAQQRERF